MKSCPRLVIFLYICLFAAVVWLASTTTTVMAATGTAECGGGQVIYCSAYRCDCQNNVGCTGYDPNGSIIESQSGKCKSEHGFELLDGPVS